MELTRYSYLVGKRGAANGRGMELPVTMGLLGILSREP